MVIESYNSKWPQQFFLIKQMLERNLREYISIEHVGSTSIPGMKAKPIIDIDVVVQDEAQFLSVKEDLEKRNRLRETPALVDEYNSIKEEILLKVGADNRAAYVDMKEKEYKWFFEKVLSGNQNMLKFELAKSSDAVVLTAISKHAFDSDVKIVPVDEGMEK